MKSRTSDARRTAMGFRPPEAIVMGIALVALAVAIIQWPVEPQSPEPLIAPEAGRADGRLLSGDVVMEGFSIMAAGHGFLEVRIELGQVDAGSIGPFLVTTDIDDDGGVRRVDGHEQGGVYIRPSDPQVHVYRMDDPADGVWEVRLSSWDGSVPVDYTMSWRAAT